MGTFVYTSWGKVWGLATLGKHPSWPFGTSGSLMGLWCEITCGRCASCGEVLVPADDTLCGDTSRDTSTCGTALGGVRTWLVSAACSVLSTALVSGEALATLARGDDALAALFARGDGKDVLVSAGVWRSNRAVRTVLYLCVCVFVCVCMRARVHAYVCACVRVWFCNLVIWAMRTKQVPFQEVRQRKCCHDFLFGLHPAQSAYFIRPLPGAHRHTGTQTTARSAHLRVVSEELRGQAAALCGLQGRALIELRPHPIRQFQYLL